MSEGLFSSLSSEDDWAEALEASEQQPVLVFKHSSACPISADANREVQELSKSTEIPVYRVVVQENRPVSDLIEDTLGVRHETPQTIVVRNQEPMYHTSHFNISTETLQKELRRVSIE